ncbi:hypothetical protein [Nonomuraea solani]|uniref:hypothetical protein n=1 Tax=Nonomuraea solani TaxID=1144553 RepID=UPI00135C0B1E|nr:hypothetical protein [Nonomuraea solani]
MLLTAGAVAGPPVGVPALAQRMPAPWLWAALSLAAQGAWMELAVLRFGRAE